MLSHKELAVTTDCGALTGPMEKRRETFRVCPFFRKFAARFRCLSAECSKGKPVRSRNCARSCVIRNGSVSIAIGGNPEKAGAGRSQKTCLSQVKYPGSGTSRCANVNTIIFMKKSLMLFTLGMLTVVACQKTPVDDALAGCEVAVYEFPGEVKKIFVLNEGQMGANNATLDFLRLTDGRYVAGAFRKMNPSAAAGLGDVGNDIAVNGDKVWMVINNSGIVEVISAENEQELAVIEIPTPRNIAFDDKYAYVTSWAGAFATYGADNSVTDSANPKGCVYRVDLNTYKVAGTVEVGYQPEGIAYHDGKLYVANSGGISSQLPPAYAYDNTVSIIDTKSFTVTRTVRVEVNLKSVYADSMGTIYVTSMGNYGDVSSGLYSFPASTPQNVSRVESYGHPTLVSASCQLGDEIFCIGTTSEFVWGAARIYSIWSVKAPGVISWYGSTLSGNPYGLCALKGLALNEYLLLVGDAADYFNPGTLSSYLIGPSGERLLWSVTAGVCPGHFAVWK